MSLLLDIKLEENSITIQINGILDITTMDDFINQMEQLPEAPSLVLDFSKLEFIDSTGIGAIMELIYLSKEKNVSIDLQGMNESIHQIFEIVGLFTILKALQKEGA